MILCVGPHLKVITYSQSPDSGQNIEGVYFENAWYILCETPSQTRGENKTQKTRT